MVYELISYEVRKEILTNEQAELKATISYIKKYRELSNFETICIADYFLRYSYNTIIKATQNRKELKGLKGKQYVIVFSKILREYVEKNQEELNTLDKVLEKFNDDNKQEIRKYFHEKYPFSDDGIE